MALELTIVTADKRFHYTRVTQVVIPTPQGQLGILPGHAPLVSLVASGVLRVFLAETGKSTLPAPQPVLFALATGMARVANDHIVLLMSEVHTHEEIDYEKTISRSHQLAHASHAPLGPIERQDIEEETAFTDAQLEVMNVTRQPR
jgi:F-type H+-transporting ATPase subunit epsilon